MACTWLFLVGIVVFLLISLVKTPPRVSNTQRQGSDVQQQHICYITSQHSLPEWQPLWPQPRQVDSFTWGSPTCTSLLNLSAKKKNLVTATQGSCLRMSEAHVSTNPTRSGECCFRSKNVYSNHHFAVEFLLVKCIIW